MKPNIPHLILLWSNRLLCDLTWRKTMERESGYCIQYLVIQHLRGSRRNMSSKPSWVTKQDLQAKQLMPIILALRKLKDKDHYKFEASLGYKVTRQPILQYEIQSQKTNHSNCFSTQMATTVECEAQASLGFIPPCVVAPNFPKCLKIWEVLLSSSTAEMLVEIPNHLQHFRQDLSIFSDLQT